MTTTVRTMRRDRLDLAIDLAAAEGSPGLHDAGLLERPACQFLVAEVDGAVAGCIQCGAL